MGAIGRVFGVSAIAPAEAATDHGIAAALSNGLNPACCQRVSDFDTCPFRDSPDGEPLGPPCPPTLV